MDARRRDRRFADIPKHDLRLFGVFQDRRKQERRRPQPEVPEPRKADDPIKPKG